MMGGRKASPAVELVRRRRCQFENEGGEGEDTTRRELN